MNNKHWGHKSYCFRVAAAAGAFCNNTFCNPFHCQEVLLCLPPSRKDRYSLCQISSSANHLKFYINNNNNNNWLIPLLPWRQNKTQTITNAMSHAMEGIQIHNKTAFIFYELYGSGCRWTILLLTPVACQQELCVTGEEMNSVNNPEYTIGERLWLDGEKAQRFCCATPQKSNRIPSQLSNHPIVIAFYIPCHTATRPSTSPVMDCCVHIVQWLSHNGPDSQIICSSSGSSAMCPEKRSGCPLPSATYRQLSCWPFGCPA